MQRALANRRLQPLGHLSGVEFLKYQCRLGQRSISATRERDANKRPLMAQNGSQSTGVQLTLRGARSG